MYYIYCILSTIGDGNWHFKEEIYPIVFLTAGKKYPHLRTVKNIDKHFNKYMSYQLIRKSKSKNIEIQGKIFEVKGHSTYQITEKGLAALDYYRVKSGGKDLNLGDLSNTEDYKNKLSQFNPKKNLKRR